MNQRNFGRWGKVKGQGEKICNHLLLFPGLTPINFMLVKYYQLLADYSVE
ncbi:MAG: hypothetical protein N2235_12345 [Fischerella sp.]|nr:hypothetical protein [Fischerella sp.]